MPYKAFNSNFSCKGFQFKVGEIYESKELKICQSGFHYCDRAIDCNNYYDHTPNTRYAEVEAFGNIASRGDKKATNKIKILREISTEEWETLINGEKDVYGDKGWYKNGLLHSPIVKDETGNDVDLPAKIYANGDQTWYQNGKEHRENDLPAVVWADGTNFWYKNGQRHRDGDKPATIEKDGSQFWFINGKLHRENDKPAIICRRLDRQLWYTNGKVHRDNGLPAVICSSGRQEWWENGVFIKIEN